MDTFDRSTPTNDPTRNADGCSVPGASDHGALEETSLDRDLVGVVGVKVFEALARRALLCARHHACAR